MNFLQWIYMHPSSLKQEAMEELPPSHGFEGLGSCLG